MRIVIDEGKSISITRESPEWGRDRFVFRYDRQSPKPYVHPIEVAGEPVTLASPHDHIHHRGLMFALRVNGVNFWEETPLDEAGHQRVRRLYGLSCTSEEATFCCDIDWVKATDETLLLAEERTLHVTFPEDGGVLVTWRSLLRADYGPARLSGERGNRKLSYMGLGVRFPRGMDGAGEHRNARGSVGAAETVGARAEWHDFSAPRDGVQVEAGIALFDHPKNPRFPTEWFAMQSKFAYVTATLVGTEAYEIAAGERLELRYGIWAHPGRLEHKAIQRMWDAWHARMT